jgi:hypothetical protein
MSLLRARRWEPKLSAQFGQPRRVSGWWKALTLTVALLILAVPVVTDSESAQAVGCGSACENISGEPILLAQQISAFFDNGQFKATSGTTYINDIYYEEILPIAQGQDPKPGCSVDTRLLQMIVITLKQYGTMTLSELNRACPTIQSNATCASGSSHCSTPSQAIDVIGVGGTRISGGGETIGYLNFLDTFMPVGTNALQWQCPGRNDNFQRLRHSSYADSCSHQHIDLGSISPSDNLLVANEAVLAGGTLVQAFGAQGGWQSIPLPLGVTSGQITTVNNGGGWPKIYANEGGTLMEISGDSAGWHKMNTGISIGTGQISAVNMGQGWPHVMVNEGGTLMQVAVVNGAWTKLNTGLNIGKSQISAVNLGEGWPRVYSNESGVLMEIYADRNGWHKGNTGLNIGKSYISAIKFAGGPQVMTNQDGVIHQIAPINGAWRNMSTGINVGTGYISAVDMNGGWPQVMANIGGTLHQVYADSAGWHLLNSGVHIGPGLVPAVNMTGTSTPAWPQVITIL